MSRRLLLIVLAVVAFLVVSLLLGRWLTVESSERNGVTALLEAQARGDAAGMLAHLDGCAQRPVCAELVRRDARELKASGDPEIEIIAYDSATRYAIGGATGDTRVVWHVAGGLPTVQCVAVERTGSLLSGVSVSLKALSGPIRRTAGC